MGPSGRRRARLTLPAAAVTGAVIILCVLLVAMLMRPNPPRPLRPTILTSSEWSPYVSPDLDGNGPLAIVVDHVFRAAGFSPQLEFTSWTAAQNRVNSGEALGTFPFISSADRRERFLLSDELATFTYVLFHRIDGPSIRSADDLASVRVARISGYEYWPELDAAAGDYVEFSTSGEALRALARGDIDVVPEGFLVGQEIVRSADFPYDSSTLGVVEGSESWQRSTRGLHLLLPRSESNERLMEAFNTHLSDFVETDNYDALLKKLEPARDVVRLTAQDGGSVPLVDDQGNMEARTPNGTAAVAIRWPNTLDESPPVVEMVEVRVLSGPWVGRHFNVHIENVTMAE